MQVFVQYEPNRTGKGLFLQRLERSIAQYGIEFKYDTYKGCDATLSFTHWRKESGRLPKVLRLDGVHMVANKRVGWRNGQISKAIAQADVAIWQSQFCRNIVGGMLGYAPRNYTIFNGIDPKIYHSVVPADSPFKRNVIACAKWSYKDGSPRRHKRLKDTAKVMAACCEADKELGCWIIGNVHKKYYECDRLRYTGWLDQDALRQYIKMADGFVYIPYFDWCPNAVVEMGGAGLWGVVSNNGGHAEISTGKVVKIDKTMKPKLLAHNPPKLTDEKISAVVQAVLDKLPDSQKHVPDWIDINTIARQYSEALRSCKCSIAD